MDTTMILKGVRLSYPSLYEKAKFNNVEGKYQASFLLDPDDDAEQLEAVKKIIVGLQKNNRVKVQESNICLRETDDGQFSIKASSAFKPIVINSDKTVLETDTGRLYAGCYVNAKINFWLQNNSYGKRINSNLLVVQFATDGEPFSAGHPNRSMIDDFEYVGDDVAEMEGLDDL